MVERERLLAPDVLAGRDDLAADLGVRGRDREVDDDLDLVEREQLVDGAVPGDAVLLGLRAGAVGVDVGDEEHLEVGELRSGSRGRCR